MRSSEVTMITAPCGARLDTSHVAWMPSRSGMWMSMSTMSGCSSAARRTASLPLAAEPISSMSGWLSTSTASVSRTVTLSSTARMRIGCGRPLEETGSAGEGIRLHLDHERITQKRADQRGDAMESVGASHVDVGQRIDGRGGWRERQIARIDPDGQVGAGLGRRGHPAGLADVRCRVAAGFARGVADDGICEVRARRVERAQHQQHEHRDGQREFDQRLGAATHRTPIGIARAQQSGQILVVFAITAASMLAVVGLLYSFGLILAQRRSLQTAADAASLSGAWTIVRELASDDRADSSVLGAVVQLATTNGADQANVSAAYVDATGAPVSVVGGGGTFPVEARGVG